MSLCCNCEGRDLAQCDGKQGCVGRQGIVKTRAERQGELVDEILAILRPQLDGQAVVDAAQYAELLAAVAHYAETVRAE